MTGDQDAPPATADCGKFAVSSSDPPGAALEFVRSGGAQRRIGIVFYRPVLVMLFTSTSLLLIAAAALVVTSWRSLERHEALATHLTLLGAFETSVRREVQLAETDDAPSQAQSTATALGTLDTDRTDAMGGLARRFAGDPEAGPDDRIQALLRTLNAEERFEWWLSIGITLALPTAGVLLALAFRRRILIPLSNLGYLMGLLAEKDYSTALTRNIDPYLKPLFERYNAMVERLIQFEKEHEDRERRLQADVQAAARTMLQQQFALANAERLAATGELASRLAHDLRNPLAGIQAAVANLIHDVQEVDLRERLEMIDSELKRVTKLLNELLRGSRQAPESAVPLDLADIVSSTMNLASYQLSDDVTLVNDVPNGLVCTLPESGLRRSLLNLLLNAGKAMDDSGGEIRVDAERVGDRLHIAVRDEGPGFPVEALASGARAFMTWGGEGTGLGLATVRRFAEDLGGELRLENLEPHGASVTLELPVRGADD